LSAALANTTRWETARGPASPSMSRRPQHGSARDGVIPSRLHAACWRLWPRNGVICSNLYD